MALSLLKHTHHLAFRKYPFMPNSYISTAFIISALSSSIALANEKITQSQEDSVQLQEVVVTGSRRATSTPLQSHSPVDIVTAAQLQATGATTVAKALTQLSPSVSLPTTPVGGFAASTPPSIALRGLTGDQTLVLVNGKRRHTSSYFTRQAYAGGRGAAVVDLSLIPISAVKRIEILRDGAAAQYGSDAVAGVVNIILKDQDSGGGVNYSFGGYEKGDGEQQQLSGWKGFSLPNDGFATLAFDLGKRESANNTNPDNRLFYDPKITNPYANYQYNENNSPLRHWKFGAPKVKNQFNLLANAELPLEDGRKFYAFATYGERTSVGENFAELPSNKNLLNRSEYYLKRYPDGRIPITQVNVQDYSLTAGYKHGSKDEQGELDIFTNYGRNKNSSTQFEGINPSYGPDSPSSYFVGDNIAEQINAGVDFTKNIENTIFHSPVTLAAGLAYRWDKYEQVAGDRIAWTRGSFYNPSQTSGVGIPEIYAGITGEDQHSVDREVYGIYLDLETDVTEKLNAGVAIRAEDYSDFGSTANGKISAKYDINSKFSVRGSASTGYRAPSTVQLGYSAFSVQTQQFADGWRDVQQRTLLPGSEAAQRLGGKNLEPEKTNNLSLGFVFQPWKNTSLTIDLYQIDIDDRILLSDNITGTAVTNALAGTPYSNIGNVAFFNNLLDTRTRGLELTAKHRLDLNEYGDILLSLGYSQNKTRITASRNAQTITGDTITSATIATRNTRALIEEGTPKNKLTLGASWRLGDWSIQPAVRRYDEFTTRNATDPQKDQTYGAQWIADLDIGYDAQKILPGLKFNIGANNLFNSFPDGSVDGSVGGVVKYSFNSPEGANGAYYYAQVGYDF